MDPQQPTTKQQRKRSPSPSSTRRAESPTKRAESPTRQQKPIPTGQYEQDGGSYPASESATRFANLNFKDFEFRNLNQDPTVNLFNRMFSRDTHKLLGLSGIKVSRICLGSMNFGEVDQRFGQRVGQLDEQAAHKILDRYVELGGNCIDTANFFPWFGQNSGESEKIIGNWLTKRSDRERLVIISKIRLPTDPANVNAIGLSRSNVISSVEGILCRLQTKYIDLLQIDGWDYTVDVKEVVRVFDELLMSGKVRNMGLCDFKGWQLQRMVDTSKLLNKHKFTCYQGEYNLLSRGCEMEVVDVCLNERLGFIAYSPFKYGFLTNPSFENTTTGEPNLQQQQGESNINNTQQQQQHNIPSLANSNLSIMGEPFEIMKTNPCFKQLYSTIQSISNSHNISMLQIALRWVLQKEFVSTVVIGVNNVEELEESMRVLTEFELTEDEMIQLNRASMSYLPYPYLSIPTDIGRKLYSQTPGPIVYSQLAYLTQAITLNDRMFDFGYSVPFFDENKYEHFQQFGLKHQKQQAGKIYHKEHGKKQQLVQGQEQPLMHESTTTTTQQENLPLQHEKQQHQHRQSSPPKV